MKITILQNQIKNDAIIKTGISKAVELLKSIGITTEVTYKTVNLPLAPVVFNPTMSGVNYQPILNAIDGSEDIVCLIYNADGIIPKPTNPATFHIKKGNTIPMEIPEFWFGGYANVLAQFFLHELAHSESFRYGKPDYTHEQFNPMWNGQWNQKSNEEYYLFLLKGLVPITPPIIIPVTKYKYFKPNEVVGLKPELVSLLDKARGLAGIPFVITSGYRNVNKNDEVGGVEDSSHTKGEAVDLRARNSNEHFIITKALFQVGFIRISRKYPFHIHTDISQDKPQNVLF